DEPTLPFGLQDVQGDGRGIEEARQSLDIDLSRRLRVQARQLGVSSASLYHLAWARVLGAVSGKEDVVFGTVLLGRLQGGAGSDRALGMFINTLPLRVTLGEQGVRSGLKATHARLSGLLAHEHASLVLAQRCSGVPASTPLFSSLLNFRHTGDLDASDQALAAWEGIQALHGEERTNYPLTLCVDDLGEGFNLTVMAEGQIGAKRVCTYMHCVLENLVQALEQTPDAALGALNILPASERQQLLESWNTPHALQADDALIHRTFEAWVVAQPNAVALDYEERTLTYAELNTRANQVAHYLLGLGVQPDDRVAICVERSLEMIVGLLGVLKAGAGYVPIDPAYPAERIAYQLQDSAPMAVLADAAGLALLGSFDGPRVDLHSPALQAQPGHNPQLTGLSPRHLAYVIYTSGSTGLPKGVMVEHRNVARLFSATQSWFGFNEQDVWALFHSFAFDFSVWEIWGALLHGGRLLIVPQLVSRSPQDCYALLCNAGVTVLNQTPSAFRQLLNAQGESDQRHSLRQVIFGGEALDTGMLKPWYARVINAGTQLVNMYGITETTVHVTYHPLVAADAQRSGVSPIGVRIPDFQLYVLDARREPVPVGVVGELYVGGAGVARGYLNREALTAERFLANPFSKEPQARLYRTGDLGRWMADGSLDYLGRNDDQVKIRGFRIELGEIQAVLAACNTVREALVLVREDQPGDKRLVAYVIAAPGHEIVAADLRAQLLLSLADYMVPSAFVALDSFPLTANGKLDQKALPAPDAQALAMREYAPPEGDVEIAIAHIWQSLLQVPQVGRHDHFFELGGHSLLAVKLIERMRQIDLSADVRVLFSQPTLAALAAAVGGYTEVQVPDNLIVQGCERITPDMLPLADLDQAGIDRVVASVPGGLANIQDIYALAPLQEGILYHHLAADEGDPYVLQMLFAFDDRECLAGFAAALQSVVERHDILRTSVVWEGLEQPVQVVWRNAKLSLEEVTIDPLDGDVLTRLRERFDPRHYRLDIGQAPLMRIAYAEDNTHQRLVGMLLFHHLALDHTSLEMVVEEMQASLQGQIEQLPTPVPYRNHVAQARLGISQAEHEAFFRDMLGDIDEPTLAYGIQDVQGDGSGIEEVHQVLDSQLSSRIRSIARQLGVSAASLAHLAWAQVAGRVSGREEVVFGTVLMGRMQGGNGADRALGMFINTLPLRISVGSQSALAAVKVTHQRLSALLGHEHASLSLAQRCSGVPSSLPLFSTLLNYRHSNGGAASTETLSAWQGIQTLSMEERTNYPLCLNVDDLGDDFMLTIQAVKQISATRIGEHMQVALRSLVQALEHTPQAALNSLSILPDDERELLLTGFNDTAHPYPRDVLIHQLIEQQAAQRPDACAVRGDSGPLLTYAELNQQANQLAHRLIELGVEPDTRVAVSLRRGAEMVVALLGILKAGGAYVPIDPDLPSARQAYMIEDSSPQAVLTTRDLSDHLPASDLPVLVLDGHDDRAQLARQQSVNPDAKALGLQPNHLAYVLYTSGSTGTPKGVMNEHLGVVNRLLWARDAYQVNSQDRVLQKTPFGFDVSVWEFFLPLLTGAELVMARPGGHQDPDYLAQVMSDAGITLLHFVPSMLDVFLEHRSTRDFPQLRRVLCSGEALPRALQRRFEQQLKGVELHNLYGPTEAAIDVTAWECRPTDPGESVPIGRPIANIQMHVLDALGQLQPLGVAGELHIGGIGVARGYLNQPELSAERFIADPFSDAPQARLYKTGDVGRWLTNGALEYLGRNDFQVKIRGLRIEIGEIEAALAKHPAVHEAVVTAREDIPGDKRLVAYYTQSAEHTAVDIETLRSHLQQVLPEYMVPAIYVLLEAMPLTSNGKLDRKALPAPDGDALISRGYEAPQGEIEEQIALIWQDLLGVEEVGRHDHFFELGGHSLLAVSLTGRMRQLGLSADVRVLFSQPTLAALAAAVGGGTEIVVPANLISEDCQRITPELLPLANLTQAQIDQVVATVPGGVTNVQDIYPLAPLQAGILYHHLAAEIGDPYVLQTQFAFDNRERLNAFVQALQMVIDRHDILRTSVVWDGLESPVQVVWRQAQLHLDALELDPADGDIGAQLHSRFDPRHYRLNIGQAPLMRVAYAEDPLNQRICAMLLFHHMALDHVALEVVKHEMQAWLAGEADTLAASVPVPYRNYVAQARLGVSQADHEAFFRDMLGDIDEPTLPFGLQDVQGEGRDIEEASLALDPQMSLRLRAQARQQGVSAASLVHLAWAQVLGKVSNRQDVVFGTVLMGRMQGGEGAERALGMFINTLPLRVSVGEQGVRDGVKATHKRLTALLGHEHASLALAQRCSGVAAPAPLFSALLNYRHSGVGSVSDQAMQAWQGIAVLSGEERTNYPLTLNVDDLGEGFSLTALVVSSIGAQRVCGYMHTALENLLTALEQTPETSLQGLSILPVVEREQLLVAFNDTALDYPQQQTIHGMFEAQVERTPEGVAVVHGEQRLTYRELNQQANRLAHALIKQGVQPDSRVGICVERGAAMVVGLLAVLKAGGGYVPLDPAYPAERIAYMLQDSAPAAVLAQTATQGLLADVSVPVINLDLSDWQDESVQNPQVPGLTSAHLAYLIYTSGSTGLPKGVMIEHRNTVNFLTWAHTAFDGPALGKTLFSTSLNFDLAVYECFAPLTSGGSINVVKNVLELQYGEHDIGLINTVPSALKALLDVDGLPESVHTVNVAGEALKRSLVEDLFERTGVQRLCNLYGPSETTTYSSWVAMDREDGFAAHIGKPVGNTQFYLLDEQQQPVPLGVAGEIYIGGAGVARGYLNRDDLTAERFVKDPFSSQPAARMYRTGDLGRNLPDGNIEYLGRNDDQVKIRGFRIELGEIDARLAKHPAIHEAVVTAREDVPGDKRLVAYYTLAFGHTSADIDSLRSWLQEQLPAYMIPVAYVLLDALPLTPNGKLDRKALPAPEADALISRGYEAPQGETETQIAAIWQDLLGVAQVGRHDNFFELGGHSLLAVSLIGRMRQSGLSSDVRVLFGQPTLAALAAAVGGGTEIVVPANLITEHCEHITPDLLPLADLTQAQIDQVVASVPGGVANVQDIYPLSPLQEGILYHHLSAERGDPYLLQSLFAFDSQEHVDDFSRALQFVIQRHDILRTALVWEGLDEPMQVVWRQALLMRESFEPDPQGGDVATQLHQRFDSRHQRLDIRRAPMMRLVHAWDEPNQRWLGWLQFHHLVMDHTTLEVVRHEMQACLLGQGAQLGLTVPYRNYIAQVRLGMSQEEHEAFFRDMLSDVDEATLPFGLQEVQGDGHDIEEGCLAVDLELSRRLRAQARQLGVSAASLVHLAWAQLLSKASGRDDVVFGTVLLGRMQGGEGSERALGVFINTLPLRVSLGDQGVRDGVKATHRRLTALLGHEHASLALAQRCSGVVAPAPLFSALLNYRHTSVAVTDETLTAWNGMHALALGDEERTNYPLTLNVDDRGEDFLLTVQTVPLIDGARICAYMQQTLSNLVNALEQAPQTPLHAIAILPDSEREQLLEQWKQPGTAYTSETCTSETPIHLQFEARAAQQPDAVALVFETQTLSYGELNARANQVAHRLLAHGVRPDDRVAICVERGPAMIIGLLGILKSGAGYVPLDPAYPLERLAYTLGDSAPVALLSQRSVQSTLPASEVPVISLDDDLQGESVCNPQVPVKPSNLAYVIYTSGSTGLPKGVMVEHRNVARLFSATEEWFGFNEQDVWALFHSFAFDFSVWEIWGALLHGGRLLIVPQLVSRSPEDFYNLLCSAGVTVLNQTPSAFRQLIAAQAENTQAHSLRQVIFGGEALETAMLKPWYARQANAGTQLVNMYGITETTVHVTYYPLQPEDAQRLGASPIGRRIPDLQLYVLDARGEPVPVGVVGELYVGGAGVARGYLNREALTAERFLDNPFSHTADARMYRTGDLGRWLADGSLEYLGRNDEQVKIRGFRIELGEIEARLAEYPDVRDAVVLCREDVPGDKRLVAYVTAQQPESLLDIESLREHLQGALPEHMVPAAYVQLDELPLTANGKLDRKALPVPDRSALASRGYAAPENDTEMAIARIWQDLLQLEQVGRHDNFFELGGHSLLAVKLIERMRQIDLVADVRVLFSQPTLSALAAAVGGKGAVEVPANLIPAGCERITPDMLPLAALSQDDIDRVVASVPGGLANVQDIYALAPLQEGILYHHLAATEGDPYLQYALFAFDSLERLHSFAQALQGVIDRHDILRTAVLWERLDAAVQVIWREAPLGMDEWVLNPADGDIAEQLLKRLDPRHTRLDIRQAPMLRIGYAHDAENDRWLGMLLFHHLVDDATSLRTLTSEIESYMLGQQASLPPSVPYRNYVAQAMLGVSREEHEAFFRDMLGDIDEPTLPFGLLDVQGDGRGIEEVHQPVDMDLSRRLRLQARQFGVSSASLYHLAWARVLGAVSGKEEVVFGTVLLGRLQGGAGSDRALGMFINT
ncbi:syringopeptin non-ribosomal peptide synthetase SypC, partial [Pseudomonas syringae]|nr:syringopeptin non-ribosomal peptide synthetase SypC [Pseudomonas syringae]